MAGALVSGGSELPQDVMQDTAVTVVLRFFWGIDPHPFLELLHVTIFSDSRNRDYT
jgi:hypothetical protein